MNFEIDTFAKDLSEFEQGVFMFLFDNHPGVPPSIDEHFKISRSTPWFFNHDVRLVGHNVGDFVDYYIENSWEDWGPRELQAAILEN